MFKHIDCIYILRVLDIIMALKTRANYLCQSGVYKIYGQIIGV